MTLPVIRPPFNGSDEDGDAVATRPDASVAGVLLAAGSSSRFGESDKLLASLDDDPLVRHAARNLRYASELDAVAVVVGGNADGVRDALDGFGLPIVENPDAERGQATSVRAGVEWGREYDAIVFALGDMPHVQTRSINRLVSAYRAGSGDALAAAFDGRRGNPVLFDSIHFDALADVSGDIGGREILLDGEHSALIETGDPGVLLDVDTKGDLRNVRYE
ncbi:NTP transferase domain-containing protein [Haladaptatus sp. R4]|uniref:nucleotidyltransferase family protein n=1 Tax=Haladaptatus sp. R4 TaxID=1679489 RepID=UPI000AFB0E1B|nr:nucleotidyltransferase family protein [Haladaptatus sp. R4]